MLRRRAVTDKQLPLQPKAGNPVAHALFRFRRRSFDLRPKFLQSVALIGIQGRQIIAVSLRFPLRIGLGRGAAESTW